MSGPRPAAAEEAPTVAPTVAPRSTSRSAAWRSGASRSVAWRVAVVLVLAQLATGFVAVGLTAALVERRVKDLAAQGLRARLETVADELQVSLDPSMPLDAAPAVLVRDLARRFADPVAFVHADGTLAQRSDTATA